ncbi:helix-turn-helix transcriptional regulator [Subsaximicrobium wynnwilliamsii]|uniref:Helix-turn-helix transcriptional regulator n=1 Tax=Subsaximicrobium wynnwilliamsii TaxID=291179 RepID=A0A5C6ZC29_9FLAO|nr:helix-turn-helix transcriptional regulator [Subsaximicrobium wynnwilliamsii]TXD81522.1 helix-turn-helix transcriptional regulator [Subsaximicrobium wynnwilliamsii]TXD87188.1 helix-turn-helix transcriptional regulator [Subsaximicrobium wynnwilliamsii]TXE00882.1 helix-turn-helix transcriptional regulator [Subsaximicrobium wynnwilliamsii]
MSASSNYNRIKQVLVENNKSNKWLAEKLKMSETTVSNWCTNNRQPSLPTLFKIASALEISPKNLINA